MKGPAILICLLLTLHVSAQKDKVRLELCLPCLVDFVSFPTIQGGVEYKVSPRVSWYNEIGVEYLQQLHKPDSAFVGTHGFKLKSEIRYYFKRAGERKEPGNRHYIGANIFYINDSYNTSIGYVPNPGSYNVAYDWYGVRKKVWGMNLLAGIERPAGQGKISKRVFFDLYGGLGIRLRTISTINRDVGYGNAVVLPIDLNVYRVQKDAELKGGFSILPNLTLGVRACYRL